MHTITMLAIHNYRTLSYKMIFTLASYNKTNGIYLPLKIGQMSHTVIPP